MKSSFSGGELLTMRAICITPHCFSHQMVIELDTALGMQRERANGLRKLKEPTSSLILQEDQWIADTMKGRNGRSWRVAPTQPTLLRSNQTLFSLQNYGSMLLSNHLSFGSWPPSRWVQWEISEKRIICHGRCWIAYGTIRTASWWGSPTVGILLNITTWSWFLCSGLQAMENAFEQRTHSRGTAENSHHFREGGVITPTSPCKFGLGGKHGNGSQMYGGFILRMCAGW